MSSSMSLQQMEESLARPNENGEDMQQHPIGGAYRGVAQDSEDSDSDNDNMDEDQFEKKDMEEYLSEKTVAWVDYMREFDESVKAYMAKDLPRLFGTISIGDEESNPAAQVEKGQVATKEVSAGKEEKSKSEEDLDEETAKRKKEQLEAELRKKLKEGTPQDLQLLQASLTTPTDTISQGGIQAGNCKETNPV